MGTFSKWGFNEGGYRKFSGKLAISRKDGNGEIWTRLLSITNRKWSVGFQMI